MTEQYPNQPQQTPNGLYQPQQPYPTGAPAPGGLGPVGSEWIEQDEAGNPVVWRHYPNQPQPPKRYPEPPKKKHRVFLWVFLAVQGLFILWIILGASSANGTPSDCGTLDADTCNGAEAVGATIGVALVVGLWMVVDFLMGVTYGVYRLAKRP
jgi:hypothetical protein